MTSSGFYIIHMCSLWILSLYEKQLTPPNASYRYSLIRAILINEHCKLCRKSTLVRVWQAIKNKLGQVCVFLTFPCVFIVNKTWDQLPDLIREARFILSPAPIFIWARWLRSISLSAKYALLSAAESGYFSEPVPLQGIPPLKLNINYRRPVNRNCVFITSPFTCLRGGDHRLALW